MIFIQFQHRDMQIKQKSYNKTGKHHNYAKENTERLQQPIPHKIDAKKDHINIHVNLTM